MMNIKKILNSELFYTIMLLVLFIIFVSALNNSGRGIKNTSLIYLFVIPLFATIKVKLDEVEGKDGILMYISFLISFPLFLFWFPLQIVTTTLMEFIGQYYQYVSLDNTASKIRFLIFFLISFFITSVGVTIIHMF